MPKSTIAFKYIKIYYIAFQCSLPGLSMYLFIKLIACEWSDILYTIAYIRLSTALVYDTYDIFSTSSFVGHKLANNLKWLARVLTDLTFCILNLF